MLMKNPAERPLGMFGNIVIPASVGQRAALDTLGTLQQGKLLSTHRVGTGKQPYGSLTVAVGG